MPKKKTKSTRHQKTFVGKVDHVNARHAYVVIGHQQPDIYVSTRNLLSAVHEDTVEIELLPGHRQGGIKGRVIRIIKRHRYRFVGRLETLHNCTFAIPDFRKIHQSFLIPKEQAKQTILNDKVIFEVTHWGDAWHSAKARISKTLGKKGSHETEMHAIIAEFDLPLQFSPETLEEAAAIEGTILPAERKRREDLSKTLTFTIDPDDAKDFDDALSINPRNNGLFEIGVHIADVSHYVQPGTALDREAYNRGTSVYLVDRTIPMLPERLSNELCSLRPHEEKRCFSIFFEIDEEANIHKERFSKTIIHSDHRFSYERAQQAIETNDHPCSAMLNVLNRIAQKLRKKRIENGAIGFETTELKFLLDADKKPLAIVPKERKEAHKLIEEFMLLANKSLATHMFEQQQKDSQSTFIYRTHDTPEAEKIADFATFARQFGHHINPKGKAITHSINTLMEKIVGKPEQNILQQLAIRTMAKAKYTTATKPHFGLAFAHYTHFTSPIRRYPDLIVHRMLQHALTKQKPTSTASEWEEKCVHCTEREMRATKAERASIKYKQVELMSKAVDKVYEGVITGISDFGIFVELLETRCEGMVRLRSMSDDFYKPDEKKFRVIGKRRKKVYQLGDIVTCRIRKVDIEQRTIELILE